MNIETAIPVRRTNKHREAFLRETRRADATRSTSFADSLALRQAIAIDT